MSLYSSSGKAPCWSLKSQIFFFSFTVTLQSKPDVGMFSTRDHSPCPESVHWWPGLPRWKQLRVFTPLKMRKRVLQMWKHLRCGMRGMQAWHRPENINILQQEEVVRREKHKYYQPNVFFILFSVRIIGTVSFLLFDYCYRSTTLFWRINSNPNLVTSFFQ